VNPERSGPEPTAFEVLLAAGLRGIDALRAGGALTVACTVAGMGLGVGIALILPSEYTSSASFIAQGPGPSLLPGALQSIAASVGIGAVKDFSPQFYADLVTSRPVLTSALSRPYDIPTSSTRQNYLQIEGFMGADTDLAHEKGLQHLQRRVSSRADVRTNIIAVSVAARYPRLSHDLLSALIEALDSLNIEFRQEQSRELRQFFDGRVQDARASLDSAEDVLRQFLERNRIIQGSPQLVFDQERLQRAVDLKRTVYTTVVQQREEARLQEARNVPVLTILTPPSLPVKRSGPPRRFIVAVFTLVGLGLMPALTGLRNAWGRARRG
jgi:uncharacterized protein involved in exopolysaccharide biosynthesis